MSAAVFAPRRRLAALTGLLLCTWLLVPVASGEGWNFLPAKQTGAEAFRAAHPEWDGRGVVVAILDTGVDAFAPGLQTTSAGGVKLIDVRDFSTEGDWETAEAELDGSGGEAAPVYRDEDGLLLRGAHALPVPPAGGEPVYIGVIAEKKFQNNPEVYDLNDDGDHADRFGFLVYAADRAAVEAALGVGRGYELLQGLNETARATVARERASARVWVVAVDTDGNGDLADEQLLRDYHVDHDVFALVGDDAPDSRTLMAWELNVRADEDFLGAPTAPTVEFHFDDGSHGSHCAGIAAGHDVSGQQGLDGGAPGAWVVSCKLGDNRLSGGATRTGSMKKAYEYAADFEKRWGIPVVVNMSFGIAAVEEGEDAMGGWLNDLLGEHPTLYVCTSAGNEGPGLSSVGLPATAWSVISSGAFYSVETAKDLYGTRIPRDTLFNFSSRGGEAPKPDVVAPGGALSTVPGYVDGMARFNGTSMASPQTAGAVACLVSAARAEGLDIHWGMVKRALIAGGKPVPGLGLTDQGGGLVDTGASWAILQRLARSGSAKQLLWYEIETPCPLQADGLSEAAYWRTPGGAPLAPETVTFTVRPVFHPDLTPDERDTFFRSFQFRSEADWLEVVSGKNYLRGDMGMTVTCRYLGDKLARPGASAARIIASLDGGDLDGLAAREFYLWNTVVIGDPLDAGNGFLRTYQGKDLGQAQVRRYYVDVPAAATALRVRLEVSGETGAARGAAATIEVCDPEGRPRGGWAGYATVDGNPLRDLTILPPELVTGTWEINVYSNRTAAAAADYRVTVSCDGYLADPPVVAALEREAAGKAAAGTVTVTRAFPGVFHGRVEAAVEGFLGQETVKITEQDEWTRSFSLDRTTPRAEFRLVLDEKTANLFTDCAVNLLDASGAALEATAFDGLEAEVTAELPAGAEEASFKLQVVGAFALAADMADWSFDLEQRFLLAAPLGGTVERAGGGETVLYCGVPTALALSFPGAWPAAPAGLNVFGTVRLRDERPADRRPGDRGGRLVMEIPIRLQ